MAKTFLRQPNRPPLPLFQRLPANIRQRHLQLVEIAHSRQFSRRLFVLVHVHGPLLHDRCGVDDGDFRRERGVNERLFQDDGIGNFVGAVDEAADRFPRGRQLEFHDGVHRIRRGKGIFCPTAVRWTAIRTR